MTSPGARRPAAPARSRSASRSVQERPRPCAGSPLHAPLGSADRRRRLLPPRRLPCPPSPGNPPAPRVFPGRGGRDPEGREGRRRDRGQPPSRRRGRGLDHGPPQPRGRHPRPHRVRVRARERAAPPPPRRPAADRHRHEADRPHAVRRPGPLALRPHEPLRPDHPPRLARRAAPRLQGSPARDRARPLHQRAHRARGRRAPRPTPSRRPASAPTASAAPPDRTASSG